MKLSIDERLAIINSMPREGAMTFIMKCALLKDKLKLTAEEIEIVEVLEKARNGQLENTEENKALFQEAQKKLTERQEVELSVAEMSTIQGILEKLSKEDKFPIWAVEIWKQLEGDKAE